MTRVPPNLETKLSAEMQTKFDAATKPASGMPATFQALFANPEVGSGLAGLHEVLGRTGLEPWVTLTVALTVAHEREIRLFRWRGKPVSAMRSSMG